ncbi:MAG: dihydroxyacetone kinase subunit DhaL [Acidobacteriota bacterium]|jgi:dihydroxyacetone kinase-like protein
MTDRISISDLKRMLSEAARCLRERHEYLSQLDCVAGDGDHGTTMLSASGQLEAAVAQAPSQNSRELLKDCGWRILSIDGGASSALLGTFFLGMAETASESDFGCGALAAAFESGLNAVLKQTKARPGDKTMVDALVPAVNALHAAAESGMPIPAALEGAAAAAQAGAESTKPLVAHYGRAKFLGEKTLGHADPGAVSMALLFQGFSEALVPRREIDHGGF